MQYCDTISQVADCFYNKFDIKEKLLTSQPFALPLNNYSNSIYTFVRQTLTKKNLFSHTEVICKLGSLENSWIVVTEPKMFA